MLYTICSVVSSCVCNVRSGRCLCLIGRDPSISKSNRLHVDTFWFDLVILSLFIWDYQSWSGVFIYLFIRFMIKIYIIFYFFWLDRRGYEYLMMILFVFLFHLRVYVYDARVFIPRQNRPSINMMYGHSILELEPPWLVIHKLCDWPRRPKWSKFMLK